MRWSILVLAACGSHAATGTQPTPSNTRAEIVQHADLVARFTAKGYTITKVSDDETLACKGRACVCLAELRCEGACIKLADNLAIFKRALAGDGEHGSVTCELADTGKLCDTSYFRFEGDIYRLEDRYFDASGTLIGQRNATDYDEYCEGGAHVRFMGAVPDCHERVRDIEVICTDHHHDWPFENPMDRLLGYLKP